MADKRAGSLYARRLQKERSIPPPEIERRINWSLPVLAQNSKTSVSLDLPIHNCQPTAACSAVCYACQGTQYFRGSVVKSLALARMIEESPERVARKAVDEAQGRTIRLAGSGDILPEHKTLIDYIEQYSGRWWGFTRRVDTHRVLPDLMFSIDATTPAGVMAYVREEVPVDRRAYLRRTDDPEPPIDVAVTFPVHGPVTLQYHGIEEHPTDCPEIRGLVSGCWDCGRCYPQQRRE